MVEPTPKFLSQFASRELVSDLLNGERSLLSDPNWRSFGFSSIEYEYWAPRLCGLICMKMITDAYLLTQDMTVAELTELAESMGGYDRQSQAGWRYWPLIEFARSFGLDGDIASDLTLDRICREVLDNRFIIASVHPGVIRGDFVDSPTGLKGGHLVVISGISVKNSQCEAVIIENPSGRTPEMQEHASIGIDQFGRAFAGRGFLIWKPLEETTR